MSSLEVLNRINKIAADKKFRYAALSLGISILLYYFTILVTNERILLYAVVLSILVALVVGMIFQISKKLPLGFSYSIVLPVHLIIGFLTTFYYFPNLGPIVRFLAFFGAGIGLYITFLVNNIFLVVEERKDTFPLYTAAVTWVQILVVVIFIPFVSGVLKIPTLYYSQAIIIFISGLLLCSYMIWCLAFDSDTKETPSSEKLVVTLFSGFMLMISSIGTAFIPSETFLRSLFISSILMLMVTYIYGHYKNNLNSKIIYQNLVISLIFFGLMLVF